MPRPVTFLPPGPYQLDEVRVQTLLVDAQNTAMQATIEAALPKLVNVTYTVLFDRALLTVVEVGRARSRAPGYEHLGHTSEREVAFWIPVSVKLPGLLAQTTLFAPRLWVDEPFAVSLGREVYGFEKTLARIELVWPADKRLRSLKVFAPQPAAGGGVEEAPVLAVEVGPKLSTRAMEDLFGGLRPPWLLARKVRHAGQTPWHGMAELSTLLPKGGQKWPAFSSAPYRVSLAPSALYDLAGELGVASTFESRLGLQIHDASLELDESTFLASDSL